MRKISMMLAIVALFAMPLLAEADRPDAAAEGSVDGCQDFTPMPTEGVPDPIEQAACVLIDGRTCQAGQVVHCSWGSSIGTCYCVNGTFDCGNPP